MPRVGNLFLAFCADAQLLRCGEKIRILCYFSIPPEKQGKGG
jgi:hypothetical protein